MITSSNKKLLVKKLLRSLIIQVIMPFSSQTSSNNTSGTIFQTKPYFENNLLTWHFSARVTCFEREAHVNNVKDNDYLQEFVKHFLQLYNKKFNNIPEDIKISLYYFSNILQVF